MTAPQAGPQPAPPGLGVMADVSPAWALMQLSGAAAQQGQGCPLCATMPLHVSCVPAGGSLPHGCAPVPGTRHVGPREAVPSLLAQPLPLDSPVLLSPWPQDSPALGAGAC